MKLMSVGDQIKLETVLADGNEAQYIRAFLYNTLNTFIGSYDLDHVANGFYSGNGPLMPNTAQVLALFRVYSDAARTVLNDDYEQGEEIFQQATIEATNENVIDPLALVPLFGVVEGSDLAGVFEPSDIVGAVSADSLVGVDSSESNSSGTILNNDLEGDL